MMKVVFTKSALPLSYLIRKILDDDCSHMAIIFDDKIVFHSNLKGVHLEWYSNFVAKSTIVHEIEYNLTLEQEEAIYLRAPKINGKWYDYGAFAYFSIRAILNKYCMMPMPKKNLWASDGSFLCLALAKTIDPTISEDLEMMRPSDVYKLLKDRT